MAVTEARHGEVGQDERLALLARPKRPGLEDGGDGQGPGEGVQVEDQVHHHVLLDEVVPSGEAPRAEERVLNDAHHGLVRLRRDDAPRHRHDLGGLCPCLHALHHVQVHLVAIKVGVVRRGDGEIEPEGGVGHDAHAMRHDRHLVKRRLPVEHDNVAVLDVPLDFVAVLQVLQHRGVPEVETHAVGPDDIPRAWQLNGSVVDQLLQPVDVVRRHHLRVGQVAGDGPRDANLVDG
mmetsp:Transcript_25765/g.81410  ORF Transcript_25765/g.81410 Transcript_25765/m.81410 type:complete len:234 (+) Transcript_25765:3057-3758(+)